MFVVCIFWNKALMSFFYFILFFFLGTHFQVCTSFINSSKQQILNVSKIIIKSKVILLMRTDQCVSLYVG